MGKILSQTSEHNEINVAVAGYCTCTKYITTESQQESVELSTYLSHIHVHVIFTFLFQTISF
jgi:hypothetical protein